MRSLDANVILRVLLDDDASQTPVAQAALMTECLVLPTVLIEVVWVMQRSASRRRADIVVQLRDFLSLPNIIFVEAAAVRWAIDAYATGADFADMLHLAMSGAADSFATFDQDIARFADDSVIPVETLGAA